MSQKLTSLPWLAWFYCANFLFIVTLSHRPGLTHADGRLLGLFAIDPVDGDDALDRILARQTGAGVRMKPGGSTVEYAIKGVYRFEDIAGNDEMLLTAIAPAAWKADLADGRALFAMELRTGPESQRVAIQAPVKALARLLREIETRGLRVEPRFDY